MDKKLIIFGGGPFARYLRACIEESARRVEAFCVDQAYLAGAEKADIPTVAFESLDELYGKGNFEVLVSVGYHAMNENRAKVFARCDARGYAIASYVHPTACVRAQSLGRGNIILSHCALNYFCTLGEGNILIDYTAIGHETQVGDFCFIAGATTGGMAEIGDYCFIGMKSVTCEQVKLAHHTLVGAGAVVSRDTKPYTAVMPAKNRIIEAGSTELLESLLT